MAAELRFQYARSSGPGGQNVNKVNSKATLKWNVAESQGITEAVRKRFFTKYESQITKYNEIVISSDSSRDQKANAKDCYDRLRQMLVSVAKPPKKRRKTKPTGASKRKRLDSKRQRGETKKNRQNVRGDW